jgi:hypothetical protein
MRFDLRALEMLEFGSEASETACFSERELEERSGFPEWLEKAFAADAGKRGYGFDRIWEAYFGELKSLAERSGSNFLRSWVSWEVGLRNTVAGIRAGRAGLDGAQYLMEGMSDEHQSIFRPAVDSLVSFMDGGFDSWREMDRFMSRLMLEKARSLAPAYTFNTDELLSYAIQFVILRSGSYLSH